MKILKCNKCGNVTSYVHTEIIVRQSLKMTIKGEFRVDSDFDHVYGRPVELVNDGPFECAECEKPELEIVDVDECPHDWHSGWKATIRECHICGIKQEARVIFE